MTTSPCLDDPELRDEIPRCWTDQAKTIAARFRFAEGIRPWNWLELDKAESEKVWTSLIAFVDYFNSRYAERTDRRIPPCWAEHGALVEELTTLMFARWQAFESEHASIGGAQYWHAYTLPSFYERMRSWLGSGLMYCQHGRHQDIDHKGSSLERSWAVRTEIISVIEVEKRQRARTKSNSHDDTMSTRLEIPFLARSNTTVGDRNDD
jgi:hypothetical protein